MTKFSIHTQQRNQLIDVTSQVRQSLAGVKAGICIVYCPHTTAAVTINENADPDVPHDILLFLERAIPQKQAGFRHCEDNSDSHIKASLVGSSVTLIVEEGNLVLGRWQGVFFCEFDGPRTRSVHVQTIASQ